MQCSPLYNRPPLLNSQRTSLLTRTFTMLVVHSHEASAELDGSEDEVEVTEAEEDVVVLEDLEIHHEVDLATQVETFTVLHVDTWDISSE